MAPALGAGLDYSRRFTVAEDGFMQRKGALARMPALTDFSIVRNLVLTLGIAAAFLAGACERAVSDETKKTLATDASPGWLTDYKKALGEAKANHKLVLVNFTGSDWCGYCILLDRAILSKPEFKDYANKNLVLLEIDYPRHGGPKWNAQSMEVKKQNAQLGEKYQVEGFPTLVVLDGDGKTVWRVDGYYNGGLAAFLAELDKARKG